MNNKHYLKLNENFFDSTEVILLESMPDGYLYSNILLKMYLLSMNNGGYVASADGMPYFVETLPRVLNHYVGVVEKAVKIFEEMGLVDVSDTGAIYMVDIAKIIGKSTTDEERSNP